MLGIVFSSFSTKVLGQNIYQPFTTIESAHDKIKNEKAQRTEEDPVSENWKIERGSWE